MGTRDRQDRTPANLTEGKDTTHYHAINERDGKKLRRTMRSVAWVPAGEDREHQVLVNNQICHFLPPPDVDVDVDVDVSQSEAAVTGHDGGSGRSSNSGRKQDLRRNCLDQDDVGW